MVTEDRGRRADDYPVDPTGIDEPHDVLAAEEFGIGTRDERYPADPTGIEGPHDVLAAEEFAMPAAGADGQTGLRSPTVPAWLPVALMAAALLAVLWRRRS